MILVALELSQSTVTIGLLLLLLLFNVIVAICGRFVVKGIAREFRLLYRLWAQGQDVRRRPNS